MDAQNLIPVPPPSFPGSASTSFACQLMFMNNLTPRWCSYVSTATRDLWDHLFDEAYEADVCINTRNGDILFAHSNVLDFFYVSTATRDLWDHLFDEAYKADVCINTRNGGILFAQSNVLGMASPVFKGMLKQTSRRHGRRSISILGVPHDAVRVFIRFLYSSWHVPSLLFEVLLNFYI
ncbi:hypothetical protein K1719_015403 [Acacia pycnantha]|nr:hypothetical protein K1719_015403 [Acacia pycnantha]